MTSTVSTVAATSSSRISPIPSPCLSVLIQNWMKDFRPQTIKKITSLQLSTVEHCPDQTSSLWKESTTMVPRTFPADECWDEECLPSTSKLIISTLNLIESTKNTEGRPYDVYRRSEQAPKVDARLAIAQLVEPSEASPVTMIGLDILPEGSFHIPVSLSEFVEGVDEANQQLILTPKFAFTDLHLDTSDGISSPLGNCRKMWLVFPPTAKNLQLMKKADGQRAKLERIGSQLEGGLTFTTNSTEAIYLPAGCIHAVITLEGGFLVAVDFTTPLSSKPHSAMILAGLDDSGAASQFRQEVYRRFLSCADYGLAFRQDALVLSSWIEALEKIRSYAKESPKWKAAATKIWEEFFKKKEAKEAVCACGKQGKTRFVDHFKRNHMWQVGKGGKRKLEDEDGKEACQEKRPTRVSKRLRSK